MEFYLFNLLIVTILMVLFRKDKRRMLLIVFFWLFCILAFRGEGVGDDYYNYKMYFMRYKDIEWTSAVLQSEGFYWLLNKIVISLGGTFQVFIGVTAFLSLIGVVWFIDRHSYYPAISVWLFVTMCSYQTIMTRMRQALAISVLLFAYDFAKNRQLKKYVFAVFAASMFHVTAWAALIVYPIVNKRLDVRKGFFISTGLIIAMLSRSFFESMIGRLIQGTRFWHYQEESMGGGENLLIVYLLIYIFLLLAERFSRGNDVNQEGTMLYAFSSCTVLFQILAGVIGIINRAGTYFSDPMMLQLPNVAKSFRTSSRKLVLGFIIFLSGMFYIFMLATSKSSAINYHTFWQ